MATGLARYTGGGGGGSLSSLYSRALGREPGQGFSGGLDRIREQLESGGEAVRQSGESILIGGALGFAHVHLKTGLDVGSKKIPVDLAGGIVAMLGGIALPENEGGSDLRNTGAAMLSVFAFRKGYEFAQKKKGSAGGQLASTKVAGELDEAEADMGEDPILAAAMAL